MLLGKVHSEEEENWSESFEKQYTGEATDAFLKDSGMTAPAGVGYCLAVRKE